MRKHAIRIREPDLQVITLVQCYTQAGRNYTISSKKQQQQLPRSKLQTGDLALYMRPPHGQ